MSTFGSRLKVLRGLKGLTQEKLAESINEMFSTSINKSMISKWENDKEDASMTNVRYIAKFFDIKLDKLLDVDPDNSLHTILKEERIEQGLNIHEIAKEVGVSDTDLILFEEGLKNIPEGVDKEIARSLGTDLIELIVKYDVFDGEIPEIFNGDLRAYLQFKEAEESDAVSEGFLTVSNIYPIEKKKFPLLGNIACGQPTLTTNNFEGYIESGSNIRADFCIKAKGNSMMNARILDGDIIFIRKQDMVENGEIAAVLIGEEATLKRFYMSDDEIQLIAENPTIPTQRYRKEELNGIRILGKAIAFQSDVI